MGKEELDFSGTDKIYPFNLSDKIAGCEATETGYYEPEDVKEFIRLLKEEIIYNFPISRISTIEIIDKLAGKSLIQDED